MSNTRYYTINTAPIRAPSPANALRLWAEAHLPRLAQGETIYIDRITRKQYRTTLSQLREQEEREEEHRRDQATRDRREVVTDPRTENKAGVDATGVYHRGDGVRPCGCCGGTGKYNDGGCPACGGSGRGGT